jgi:hypothetical protein
MFITEEYFTKYINIKTQLKQKLIIKVINSIKLEGLGGETRGCIFSLVRPFYERAVSNLDP